MTININELRQLAQAATPIDTDLCGDRYFTAQYSIATLTKEQDGFITAANPAAITELLDRLEASEQEVIEQARLNGMGSEREALLMARLEAAEKDNQRKQKRIEQLDHALRVMTKTYKSVAYAQWPAEVHLAYEVLEESK